MRGARPQARHVSCELSPMRRFLSRARFIALLLPLYCIFVNVQLGCSGLIVDNTAREPIEAGPHPTPQPGPDRYYGYDEDGYGYGNDFDDDDGYAYGKH